MKLVIFGSNGMLGNYMSSYFFKTNEIINLTRKDLDLSTITFENIEKLFKVKNIQKNDIIINCAGIIPQSSKQRSLNSRLYFKINSLFPVILSSVCDKYGVKMFHITTDCVFSGKNGNYNENSEHDEVNDYGMSKSLGELCSATIIRTSIIGEEINNKRSLVEWIKSNRNCEINGFKNHIWNGVTCLQLSKIIREIIDNNLFWNGVKHIYSPRKVSKYELVSMVNDIYNLNIKINPINTEEKCDKSITSIYQNDFNIPDLYEQIKEMKEFKLMNNK